MNIEQEIREIKELLHTLIQQTAPPPTVRAKVKARTVARQLLAERAERRQK
jgi:hypothetical protein